MSNKRKNQKKLSGEGKEFVLQKLALGAGPSAVASEYAELFGDDICPSAVSYYKKKYAREIGDIVITTNNDISRIPVANIGYRLRKIQYLIDDLEAELSEAQTLNAAAIDDKMARAIVHNKVRYVGQIADLLNQARSEIGQEMHQDQKERFLRALLERGGEHIEAFIMGSDVD